MTIDFTKIQAAFDSYKEKIEKEAANRKKAEEKRAEEARKDFINNGIVYSIMSSSNGYTATVSSGINNDDILEPVIDIAENKVKEIKVRPATASLIAIDRVLRNLDENSRKNIVFTVQSSEVRRVAGIIRRAKKGEPVQLTERELEYIKANDRNYDEAYTTVANGLANIIKKTIEAGYKISVISNSDLHSFSLSYQPENAEALNGKVVSFANGRATIGHQTLRIANYNLNGMHKLIVYKGYLGVERKISWEKNPATFVAQNLFTFANHAVNSATINIAKENDNIDTDEDLDAII